MSIGYREEHLIGVAIGDISGKGMGAALMMALVLSAVETQVREAQYPQVLLSTLNRSLLTHLKNNHMNAGLMYITIDLHLQRMQVANAGMIAPLLIRAGTVQTIDVYGLPIGAMANPIYQEVQVHLQPNDVIVLVSDGIVEAHNAKGELFGFERLDQVLRRHVLPPDPSRLIDELMCATQNFTASCHQHDDMTVVSICPRLSPEHRKINDGTVH